MVKKWFFTCLTVCLLAFMEKPYEKSAERRPVIIFYQPTVPADSVQDFLRVCFGMYKWVVLDTAERTTLLRDHFQQLFKESLDFLKENHRVMDEAEKEEWTKRFMQPPYNHLNVRVFNSTTRPGLETDSIQWQVRSSQMDTNQYRLYIPAPGRKPIYAGFKDFADSVIASGMLR